MNKTCECKIFVVFFGYNLCLVSQTFGILFFNRSDFLVKKVGILEYVLVRLKKRSE